MALQLIATEGKYRPCLARREYLSNGAQFNCHLLRKYKYLEQKNISWFVFDAYWFPNPHWNDKFYPYANEIVWDTPGSMRNMIQTHHMENVVVMNTLIKSSFPNVSIKLVLSLSATLAFCPLPSTASTFFNQTNLVTDNQSTNPAQITDPNLINAWGISYGPGPFWISATGTGVSTVYTVNPATNVTTTSPLVVSIPGAGNVTGQVFNSNTAAFNGNLFLFVSMDGTVSGWRGSLGTQAETLVSGSPQNVYMGVAEGSVSGNSYIFAANFKSGAIDVIDGSGQATSLAGNFTDPNLPSGYAPFNIQSLDDKLYVTYALQDAASGDEVAGAGLGFVSVFDDEGNFLQRVASQGTLNAPWGLAIAPASFGEFAGDLLVGNFGDGKINAYSVSDYSFAGQLTETDGTPISIDGLWALSIGNDTVAGSSNAIYFTAGPNDENHGLFGVISAVPLPASIWLFGSAIIGFLSKQFSRNLKLKRRAMA